MKFHATFFSNSYEFLSESKQFHLMVVFERHLSHKLREAKKNQNWPMKVSITFFSLIYQKLLMQIGKQGPGNHGGRGSSLLESGIYIVKKILKFFSYLFGPPWIKIIPRPLGKVDFLRMHA